MPLLMSTLYQATGLCLIDAIRINRIQRQEQEGRIYWVKHRRGWSRAVISCANAFFRVAANPVVVWARAEQWQRWEIDSYHLLHRAEGYRAFAHDNATIWAEQLPGIALEAPAKEDRISEVMLMAAARELRRAHELPCPALGGSAWSHGDAHLGNFIYDDATQRARLIDFEVAHQPCLPAVERHADDLLVLVQSTMGYWPLECWLARSTLEIATYLEGVTEPERGLLLQSLRSRLAAPTGISRVWWSIRTDYIPAAERNAKISALRQALHRL